MLDWMISLAALCGATGAFALLAVALKTVSGLRSAPGVPQLPVARVHRLLAPPRRKALPSGG